MGGSHTKDNFLIKYNHGDLIKEGILMKWSPSILSGWQTRTFRLYENTLLYSEPLSWEPQEKQRIPLKSIKEVVANCAPECMADLKKPCTFKIVTWYRTYELKSSSWFEAREWVDTIKMQKMLQDHEIPSCHALPQTPDCSQPCTYEVLGSAFCEASSQQSTHEKPSSGKSLRSAFCEAFPVLAAVSGDAANETEVVEPL